MLLDIQAEAAIPNRSSQLEIIFCCHLVSKSDDIQPSFSRQKTQELSLLSYQQYYLSIDLVDLNNLQKMSSSTQRVQLSFKILLLAWLTPQIRSNPFSANKFKITAKSMNDADGHTDYSKSKKNQDLFEMQQYSKSTQNRKCDQACAISTKLYPMQGFKLGERLQYVTKPQNRVSNSFEPKKISPQLQQQKLAKPSLLNEEVLKQRKTNFFKPREDAFVMHNVIQARLSQSKIQSMLAVFNFVP